MTVFCLAQRFSGSSLGMKADGMLNITADSSPVKVFLLFFAEIMKLLVDETNGYYQQYLGYFDEGPSPKPDVS